MLPSITGKSNITASATISTSLGDNWFIPLYAPLVPSISTISPIDNVPINSALASYTKIAALPSAITNVLWLVIAMTLPITVKSTSLPASVDNATSILVGAGSGLSVSMYASSPSSSIGNKIVSSASLPKISRYCSSVKVVNLNDSPNGKPTAPCFAPNVTVAPPANVPSFHSVNACFTTTPNAFIADDITVSDCDAWSTSTPITLAPSCSSAAAITELPAPPAAACITSTPALNQADAFAL